MIESDRNSSKHLDNQILRDRYQIQSLLGRKTGRRTFLATDLATRSPVVIKLLLFGPDFTWDDLKLFEREAETLKTLDHPAIPKYLDFFEVNTKSGKGFALVQSYIKARSLQEWIQSGRSFSEAEMKAIATELLHILDYLHIRQPPVIHRDVKPSNVLLMICSDSSLGQVYLVDFGSVQTTVHNGTMTVVGTYGYMPPEQFGGQTTPASDLYALGATLIHVATGQDPRDLLHEEMRLLFEERVNLSPHLTDWLRWMTEPSLELRLKSAKQALAALEKSRLHESMLAIAKKPSDRKARVTNTRQKLEILIPAGGFSLHLLWAAVMIPLSVLGGVDLCEQAFSNWTWSFAGYLIALLGIFLLWAGLYLSWMILFTLFGRTRLCITPDEISLTLEYFGLRCLSHRSCNAPRQTITRVELVPLSYQQDSEGRTVPVLPHVIIWAETKHFVLISTTGDRSRLLDPEVRWLAQTVSAWLNLPITLHPSPETRKNDANQP